MGMPLARLLAMRETRPLDFPSRVLAAEAAIVLVAGQDAILFKTAAPITLTADVGVVEVSGQDATLRKTAHVLQAAAAVVEVAGQDAALVFAQPGATTMAAEHAVVEVVGQDAALLLGRVMVAEHATVEVAGQDAMLRQTAHVLSADVATVEVAGQDAVLARSIVMTADHATVEVAGQDATLTALPPQIAAFASAVNSGGDNPVTVAKPTGTEEGDLLLVFASATNDGITAFAITGSDWTAITPNKIAGSAHSAQLFSKVAGASEPADYTVSIGGENSSMEVIALRIPGGEIEASDVNTNDSAAATAAFDSVTAAGRALIVQFVGVDQNQIDTGGEPSGYTLLVSANSGNDNGEASAAWKNDLDGGASGAGTWALDTSDQSICVALAIKGRPDTVPLDLGDETFSNHNSNVSSWTSGNHTVAAADNLVIVSLSHERPDNATAVALDPSGENIPLSLICIFDDVGGGQSVTEFWGAFVSEGLGLDAAAVAQASFGMGLASGSMGVWTFSGAGRLPTTGDFATDGDAPTTSLTLDLDVAAGDIMLAGACLNGVITTTPTNITKQHENTSAQGAQTNAFYRGTSSDPSISFTNRRASFAAVKIVPA